MSDAPLKLWQVLAEEHRSFHGEDGVEFYLKNPRRWVEEICNAPAADDLATYVKRKLSEEQRKQLAHWDSARPLPVGLRNSLVNIFYALLGDRALVRLADPARAQRAASAAGVAPPPAGLSAESLSAVQLARVNLSLLETVRPDEVGRPDVVGRFSDERVGEADDEERLRGMYHYIRAGNHTALCLSGGGIRSATFNLGILQGLARHRLLDKFHYLSTVSGGGFIGGWLSAWIQRHPDGAKGVVKELSEPPSQPLEPDPPPLVHLRAYGNYLSPKVGLLSADTWTMIATVMRNVFLNWLVFVPMLAAMLMLPRIWARFLLRDSVNCLALGGFEVCQPWGVPWGVLIGGVAASVAMLVISLNLPSANALRNSQLMFLLMVLLPLLIASMSLTSWWSHYNRMPDAGAPPWWCFVFFALAIVAVPWFVFLYNFFTSYLARRRSAAQTKDVARPRTFEYAMKAVVATVVIGLAQLITGLLTWYVATGLLRPSDESRLLYASLGVPALLMVLGLGATLIAGFTSRFTEDSEQEWWARCGAWTLIAAAAWAVFCAIVLYGPTLFDFLASSQSFTLNPWEMDFEATAKALGALVGVISGAVTLFGGFSAQTPANEEEARQASTASKALRLATGLLAPIFLVFLYILIAFGTNVLLTSGVANRVNRLVEPRVARRPLDESLVLGGAAPDVPELGVGQAVRWEPPLPTDALDHRSVIHYSSLSVLVLALVVFLALGVLLGWLISTNRFSLHFFWRNRIVRAYLGASRRARRPHPFTGFDHEDNLNMYKLRDHHPRCAHMTGDSPPAPVEPKSNRLLHVINIALNLTSSDRLAWQERKAESFTVSPLHAGSHWLGYRRACEYTYDGISLGSAVAISGAFASPNMGYMMTSPVVRFLMTIFNVRFGWWLGNPGDLSRSSFFNRLLLKLVGDKPYTHDSPTLSVIPIVQEAFGMTDDRSPYVYLSDGGHFENFGLYEMVLRRCRLIVVSDASTDPKYAFGSLGQSIRQIRVDLGVPIELREFSITGPGLKKSGKYCAVGTIRYSCVDGNPTGNADDVDGTLVYIKPALTGREPRDVLNYAEENASFPQEFIGDQWFTESQFESYRALASHIVNEICGGRDSSPPDFSFEAFKREVHRHNLLSLDTIEEQMQSAIHSTLFRDEARTFLQSTPPQGVRQKVRQEARNKVEKYLKDLFD